MSDNQDKSMPRGIVSWISGLLILLLGCFAIALSVVAGIAFVVAALLVIPPTKRMLADVRFNPGRIVRGAIVVALIIVGLVAIGDQGPSTPRVAYEPKAETASSQPEEKQVEISYEIVKRWEIPNGGEGKVIVIPAELFNESDMARLGEKLKEDTKNDRNAFIFIFDDRSAALMRDQIGYSTSEADQDFYDKHYVGTYSRNGNSGYHQLDIYLDGLMGSNHKTIEY